MNINALMKEAQKMQQKLADAEASLLKENYEFIGQQGAIKISIRGDNKLNHIEIDDSLLNGDSKEILEDLLVLTLNEGLQTVQEKKDARLQSITGNLKLPGM